MAEITGIVSLVPGGRDGDRVALSWGNFRLEFAEDAAGAVSAVVRPEGQPEPQAADRVPRPVPSGTGELDLGAIRLSRGLSVELQVVDARGNPVQADLTCRLLDPARAGDWGSNMHWGVDADGKVTIKPAPRGRILIQTAQRPRAPRGWVVVDTTNGPVSGVRLEARTCMPLRIVNDTSDSGVWSVAVRTDDDLPVAEAQLWGPESELLLPAGSFIADIKKTGVVQRSVPITVGERGATLRVP